MKKELLSGRQFLAFASMALLSLSACFTSCRDDFDFEKAKNEFQLDVENFFDFSTVQTPKVSVNIQDAKTSTLFKIYSEDPFSYGPQGSFGMKSGVQAFYSDFTNADGSWSGDIELPAYAKELYLVYQDISGWHTLKSEVLNGNVEFNSSATKAGTRAWVWDKTSESNKVIAASSYGISENDEWRCQLRVISNTEFQYHNYFRFSFKVFTNINTTLSVQITDNNNNYIGKILKNESTTGGSWKTITIEGTFNGNENTKLVDIGENKSQFTNGKNIVLLLNGETKANFYFKDFSLIFSNDGNNRAQTWDANAADGTELNQYFYQYQPGDNYNGASPKISTMWNQSKEVHTLYTDAIYANQEDAAYGIKKADAWREWLGAYSTTGMSSDITTTVLENAYLNDNNKFHKNNDNYRHNYEKFNGGLRYANILLGANGSENNNTHTALSFTNNEIAQIMSDHSNIIQKSSSMECDRWHNWQWVCPEELRQGQDIRLTEDGQVAVTMLANYSAWASSLAYYYYTGDAPTSLDQIKPILIAPCVLLYPNGVNSDVKGTMNSQYVSMPVGTAIQLKYYGPNVEENYSGDKYTFPKDTKIGFLLKTHAWQGDNYNSGGTPSSWETSPCGTLYRTTTGALVNDLSNRKGSALKNWYDTDAQAYDPSPTEQGNPERQSVNLYYGNRTDGDCHGHAVSGEQHRGHGGAGAAAYTTKLAKYAILSFEDHTNDENYNDLVFAVKTTANITDLPTPDPEEYDGDPTSAVYTFEDLWPSKGDYDMNDVMLDVEESVKLLKVVNSNNTENRYISKQILSIKPYENYAANQNGLALRIGKNNVSGSIPALSSFVVKAKTPNGSLTTLEVDQIIDTNDEKILFITDDIKKYSYSTNRNISTPGEIVITITFPEKTLSSDFRLTFEPFIYKWEDGSKSSTWEVHLSNCAPTSKFKSSYLRTEDDKSGEENGQQYYFVRNGNYPFAIKLSGTGLDHTKEFQGLSKLLDKNIERTPINEVFPNYLDWVTSKGERNTNWYLTNSNYSTIEH